MIRTGLAIPTLVILALVGSACRTTRPAALETPASSLTVAEVLQNVTDAAALPFESVELRGDLAIRSPVFAGAFGATLRHRRADTLHAALQASAFRVEAAQALITLDSFFVHNRFERQLILGPTALLESALPGLFEGGALFDLLLGLVVPDSHEDWTLTSTSPQVVLESTRSGWEYTIDPETWRTLARQHRGPDGAIQETVRFSEYELTDGYLLPRRLVLQRPPMDVAVSASYRSITLNPVELNFALRVPEGVTRIRAEDLVLTPSGR